MRLALLTLSFFLQTVSTTPPSPTHQEAADSRFFDWFIRLLPIALSAYALFSGRTREERKNHDAIIKDLQVAKQKQEERTTGLQLQHERAMEQVEERHNTAIALLKEKLQEHQNKLDQFGLIREDMVQQKAEVVHIKETLGRMERLLEELRRK